MAPTQQLVGIELGRDREQPEARLGPAPRFDVVLDPLAEHLVAAADAEDRVTGPDARVQHVVEPRVAQQRQVLERRLGPG